MKMIMIKITVTIVMITRITRAMTGENNCFTSDVNSAVDISANGGDYDCDDEEKKENIRR